MVAEPRFGATFQLKFNIMAADIEQIALLKKRIKDLDRWLNDHPELTQSARRKILLDFLLQLETTSDKVIQQLSDELDRPRDEVDFAEFLSDIGHSVVDTQRKLDEQSRQYLEQTKSDQHIQPAIYRIPKVSASIKFGLRKAKKSGFNIIVAKNSKDDEQTLNQSLDFEIISVPPPPGFQQSLSGEIPTISFVFSLPLRDELFADIERYKLKETQAGLEKDIKLLLANKSKVLILLVGPRMTEEDEDDYLILYADNEFDKNVGIWSLRRNAASKSAVFGNILKFTAAPRSGENYNLLREIIVAHSDHQAKLLT